MNCLLSNWKTPTEFRSTHLDRQINKGNGKHENTVRLWRLCGSYMLLLNKD